jgi:DNA-directed RNA polymerase subunit RPC12/RpoP
MNTGPTSNPADVFPDKEGHAEAAAQTFLCPQCGAQMGWDARQKMLHCDYCGHQQEPDKIGEILEYDLEEFLRSGGEKAHGYGTETKAINCQQCGATTAVDPGVTSTECPFCGSNVVLEQDTAVDIIQPESLIPFQINQDLALRKYREWLSRGIFRPGDLARRAGRGQLYGVYLPFWTFDANAFSRWRAQAGYYYYVTETYTTTENGKRVTKTRQVRKTRWEPAWGQHSGNYDDVLVYATNSIDQKILEKIYPYDTNQLVPYAPHYLSGWRAELYQIDLRQAWKIGEKKVNEYERDACIKQIPGDTYRSLDVNTTITDTTFKHALMPVWIASYPYKGKVYRYMVNGQTGKVEGQKPVSWIRVTVAVVTALIIIAIIIYLVSQGESNDTMGLLTMWGLT